MNLQQFFVGWQARHVGTLGYDGSAWSFDYEEGWLLPMTLANNLRPRAIPASILSMMPEGFRAESMHGDEDAKLLSTLQQSERFMSNLVIVDAPAKIAAIPLDRLHGRLRDLSQDGTFQGKVERVPRIVGAFIAELRELVSRRTMPLMSGYQAKVPVFVDAHGNMSPAEYTPFTHILKLPGLTGDKNYSRSVIEWTCMEIARSGGLNTSEFALVALADDKIGMVSERFDICRDEDDLRLIFAEQFCAVMNKGASTMAKYKATAAEIGAKLREVSTDFTTDAREFLRLVTANLLLENGDFHLKNISMVKVAAPTLDGYRHVRLAPAYDIMNTRPFAAHPQPNSEDAVDPVVFEINGKDTDIGLRDLLALAKTLDIERDEARAIVTALAEGMMRRARELYLAPPALIARQELTLNMLRWTCQRLARRVGDILPEIANQLGDPEDGAAPPPRKRPHP